MKNNIEYTIKDALINLKKNDKRKFDETVEMHVNLGIDTAKSDQNISVFSILPKATKLKRKIIVISDQPIEKFDFVEKPYKFGTEDVIKDIIKKKDWNFDYIISEPSMMKTLGKYGKELGTKGLLPNPKKGTISTDLTKTYNNLLSQQVIIKNDKSGIVHCILGKISVSNEDLNKNFDTILQAIKKAKKSTVKGDYIKSIFLTTTMGKSYKLTDK